MAKLTSRAEDYSKWYNELVVKADLAENSSVRGCMVIKPYGYAIWEKMRDEMDKKFKETGHQNAYFPLFVPKSLFEALDETEKMLEVYAKFAEDFMAIPVFRGIKTPSERFAGADETYCIEALMQDGKALQAGTSHFLGQSFPKAFDVKFTNKEGKQEYPWASSWGTSTRLMGALIMTHSDDLGLVLPPTLAPIQVVIVPIFKGEEQLAEISQVALEIQSKLRAKGISVKFDNDTQNKPGWKFAEYELKGVPLRIALGQRDLENKTVELARRDNLTKETVSIEGLDAYIEELLKTIQSDIYNKALKFKEENITKVDSYEEFKKVLVEKGGFILAHWDGTAEEEEQIKQETKATIRCIPLNNEQEDGVSLISGKPSKQRVVFAKAY